MSLSLIKTTSLELDPEKISDQLSDIIHRFNHEVGNSLTASIAVGSLIERLIDHKDSIVSQSKSISKEAWRVALMTERLTNLLSDRVKEGGEFLSTDLLNQVLSRLKSRYFIDLSNLIVKVKEFKIVSDFDSLVFVICELISYTVKNLSQSQLQNEAPEVKFELKNENNIINILIYSETKHLTTDEIVNLTTLVCKSTDFTKNLVSTVRVVNRLKGKILMMDFKDNTGLLSGANDEFKEYVGIKVELE